MVASSYVASVALALLLVSFVPSASGMSAESKLTGTGTSSVLTVGMKSRGGAVCAKTTSWKCKDVSSLSAQPVTSGTSPDQLEEEQLVSYIDVGLVLRLGSDWTGNPQKHVLDIEGQPVSGCQSQSKEEVHFTCADTAADKGQGTYAALEVKKTCGGVIVKEYQFFNSLVGSWPQRCSTQTQTVYVYTADGEKKKLESGLCVEVKILNKLLRVSLSDLKVEIPGAAEVAEEASPNAGSLQSKSWWKDKARQLLGLVQSTTLIYAMFYQQQALNEADPDYAAFRQALQSARATHDAVVPLIQSVYERATAFSQGKTVNGSTVEFITDLTKKWLAFYGRLTDQVDACLCCSKRPPFTKEQSVTALCKLAYTIGATEADHLGTKAIKATWGGIHNLMNGVGGYLASLTANIISATGFDITPLAGRMVPEWTSKACTLTCSYRSEAYTEFQHPHVQKIPGTALTIPYFTPQLLTEALLPQLVEASEALDQ